MENKHKDHTQDENSQIDELNKVYQECLNYLESFTKGSDRVEECNSSIDEEVGSEESSKINDLDHACIDPKRGNESSEEIKDETVMKTSKENLTNTKENIFEIQNMNNTTESHKPKTIFTTENEMKSNESINSLQNEPRSERLRRLSQQLPKIIITQSCSNLDKPDKFYRVDGMSNFGFKMGVKKTPPPKKSNLRSPPPLRNKAAYGVYPKRLVSKTGMENVALISNVPFERIRLLNDTFHTLINLRWRWIVTGTVVVHFGIWLIFAVWWYVAALAHYDLEPDPPRRACVTGGKDFVTIFLASVEAQTTIGFGDRAIDEECPEAIFLFIMQLILGTGLSGVLTCVVYAKLTRPEKLSRDGVGFSKKAVVSLRDGRLCLMMRAWDLNYDHIIGSDFSAHFITTHRTAEGEILHHYARSLKLQHRQFLLWPVTLVHVIDEHSPLFRCSPEVLYNGCYEITVSLKGASASMGTFTQSQSSYLPREVIWGHRFPPVVKYDKRKQKYVIDHKKLDVIEPVDTPYCSASQLNSSADPPIGPGSPTSFSERISSFMLERSSSFRRISPQKNTLDQL